MHERFLRRGARELPRPRYAPLSFDVSEKLSEIRGLGLRLRGRSAPELLLRGCVDQLELTVRMLAARGTGAFHRHSVALFGAPSASDDVVACAWMSGPQAPRERATLSSAQAARRMRAIVRPVLGARCTVRLSKRIAAYAAAGSTSIALRHDARFTPRQVRAFAHHEGLWHVLTAINGHAQPVLTVLGSGLRGYTEAQEGGGIVSEALSGNLAPDRFVELAARLHGVFLAMEGADYLHVWRFFAEKFGEKRACHLAERVFRGGLLTGGAPFTKDAVYLRGYERVAAFARCAADEDKTAFFCGKMSLEHIPTIRMLLADRIVAPPHLLPPAWV